MAIVLLIVCIFNMGLSIIGYSSASRSVIGGIGGNGALGSPVLNNSAVSNDWNKYEILVWGIFLSNFCTPFIDSYATTFDLSSVSGSEGSGTKALSFATGSDIANSKIIQDLTTYAINNQGKSAVPIEVSYNAYGFGAWAFENSFTGSTNSSDPNNPADPTDPTMAKPKTRNATLADLFLPNKTDPDSWDFNGSYTNFTRFETVDWLGNIGNYTAQSVACGVGIGAAIGSVAPGPGTVAGGATGFVIGVPVGVVSGLGASVFQSFDNSVIQNEEYPDMAAVTCGSIPTFAIKGKNSNSNSTVIFDYRNTYDISMFSAALSKALSSDYVGKVAEFLNNTDLSTIPLYLDTFGNITAKVAGDYIVIIPAAANQYLTSERSLNLLNSLIFNAGTSRASQEGMITLAGQAKNTENIISNMVSSENSMASGINAFSNGTYTNASGAAIFYDTDTLVAHSRESYDGTLTVDTGELYKQFFDLDINDESNTIPFKIEPLNISNDLWSKSGLSDDNVKLVRDTIEAIGSLSNFLVDSAGGVKRLTYMLDYTKQSTDPDARINMFEDSFVIPVQFVEGISGAKTNQWAVYRHFLNFLYNCYKGTVSGISPNTISSILDSESKRIELAEAFIMDETTGDTASEITQSFWINNGANLFTVRDQNKLGSIKLGADFNWGSPMEFLTLHDINSNTASDGGAAIQPNFIWNNNTWFWDDKDGNYLAKTLFGRSVKVYKTSTELEQVSQVLSLREGTDFSVFSSNIYLTYLDWYGVSFDKLTGEPKSNLNMNVYSDDGLPTDINDITSSVKSKEDMENEIRKYTYLLLNPTSSEGRNYRNQILMSNLQTSIYDQYQRVVYGSSSSYNYGLMTTRNNTGFLAVENYSENFLTAWFMKDYATYAIYLIIIGIVFVVIIGVLKQRKTSWFLLAIVLVVNVVLVLPATGEIVPYVSNNVVQDVFKDKMTYWSISEQIANANTEKQMLKQMESVGGLEGTDVNESQVYSLVQTIKSIYLDRYISIKQDISNKVTSTTNTAWEEAQQYKSTRWLLPMILRQFSNSEGTADYVYVTLSDKTEDISNMYWFYCPSDAAFSQTMNGQSASGDTPSEYSKPSGINTSVGRSQVWTNFYEIASELYSGATYRCIAYDRNSDLPHTYFYLIDQVGSLTSDFSSVSPSDYKNVDDWTEAYASHLLTSANSTTYRKISDIIQQNAGTYDRYNRSTVNQIYGFLWNTESPLHYFYETVKDSFKPGVSLGAIVSDLQGAYVSDGNGGEYRRCFMVDDATHEVRDILDLENMFKNVIPYMYSVQLTAGGVDGTSGVFGDSKIADYTTYKDNLESWLFRSNWITKLMGNSEYSKPATIYYYDSTGKRIKTTVGNQMIASAYEEAGRPMVFSEAQRVQQGLSEGDLSLIELKCIAINEAVANKWTLMLNYVGENGLTREVVLRQMAVDATMEFCNQLTPAKLLNDSLKLYPDALDLRSISFDSIMCMLMLNVTHNTSFIYGDTMEAIIAEFDMFTVILLLIVAYLCALIIPFVRCVVSAALFYLGYLSVVRSLFKDNKEKANTSFGFLICHLLYLGVNILYLMVFKTLINMTTSEDVLVTPTAELNTGNPAWCLIVVLIIDILFIVASYRMFKLCIKNYKDMGMAIFKNTFEMVSMSVSSGFEKMSNKLAEFASAGKVSDSSSSRYDKSYSDVSSSGGTSKRKKSKGSSDDSATTVGETDSTGEDYDSNYYYNNGGTGGQVNDADSIDDKIDKGKAKREKAKGKEESSRKNNDSDYSRADTSWSTESKRESDKKTRSEHSSEAEMDGSIDTDM